MSARVLLAESMSPCWAVVVPRVVLVEFVIVTAPVMAEPTAVTATSFPSPAA